MTRVKSVSFQNCYCDSVCHFSIIITNIINVSMYWKRPKYCTDLITWIQWITSEPQEFIITYYHNLNEVIKRLGGLTCIILFSQFTKTTLNKKHRFITGHKRDFSDDKFLGGSHLKRCGFENPKAPGEEELCINIFSTIYHS